MSNARLTWPQIDSKGPLWRVEIALAGQTGQSYPSLMLLWCLLNNERARLGQARGGPCIPIGDMASVTDGLARPQIPAIRHLGSGDQTNIGHV